MSLSEILVILIITLLILKPKDIPIIIKTTQQLIGYLRNLTAEFSSHLHNSQDNNCDTQDEIKFYLQKIIDINGTYEGDYSIKHLKSKYHELIQLKVQELQK